MNYTPIKNLKKRKTASLVLWDTQCGAG